MADAGRSPRGVLLMAYGTPERRDDVEAYYTDIRRGRPPTPEQLADLTARYEAIGGLSPLAAMTRAQRDGLQAALDAREPGGWRVELGLKHAAPKIEEGAAALADAGCANVVGLVLAPHYSALSVGQYHERAEAVLAERGVAFIGVRSWHDRPALVGLLAERWRAAASALELPLDAVETLVTAHSLPERVLAMGDPYPGQLTETGRLLAQAVDVPSDRWRVAWQSAGRTPEPWLGPDILTVIEQLADEGREGVIVCPAGFTSDHLEVLYDVDIEAATLAEHLSLRLARTASLNADRAFLALLADVVTGAAA